MMETGLKRKKQPEAVRRALLEAAWHLAYEQGLSAVTVQAVATRAGVTKGGLFHHFPTKQALIEGLYADIVLTLDGEIDRLLAEDPEPYGRFTRAYIETTVHVIDLADDGKWIGLSLAFMSDQINNRSWNEWLSRRLTQHAETDGDPELQFVRLAADGAWLNYLQRALSGEQMRDIKTRLLAMTHRPG